MTFVRTIRCLRTYLLALFVVAQVAGVIPLIYDHTLNIYEIAPVAGHGHRQIKSTIASQDADHHHGLLDLHDQCCALHTLAGPVPRILDVTPAHFVSMRIALTKVVALTGGIPTLPDRPPKPLPLI